MSRNSLSLPSQIPGKKIPESESYTLDKTPSLITMSKNSPSSVDFTLKNKVSSVSPYPFPSLTTRQSYQHLFSELLKY